MHMHLYTLHITSVEISYISYFLSSFSCSVVPRFLLIVPKVRPMIYNIPLSLHNDTRRCVTHPGTAGTEPALFINVFIRA